MPHIVPPIPPGFHSVNVYLIVPDAAQAIDFYRRAFGATERYRLPGPGGRGIGHAEIQLGDTIIMLADETEWSLVKSPTTVKGNTIALCVYVPNVDAVFQQAVAAGATVTRPVADQFYGDRTGTVTDPFGYPWTLMTHQEDVTPAEMQRRVEAEYAKMAADASIG